MYKCTECGLEFEIKPDYCDCGNDEFVLTVVEEEKVPEPADINEPVLSEPISAEEFRKITAEQTAYNDYKTVRESFKLHVSPFALFIFILCVLLSLMVWVLWNPVNETVETVSDVIEKVENKTIPSIDKLWKNPTPQPVQTEPVQTVQKQEPVKKVTTPLTNNTQRKPVTVNKPVVKQQSKPTTTVNKTQQNPVANTQSVNKAQEDAKKAQEEAAKKTAEAAKKAQEAKQKTEAEALAAAEKAKKSAQAKQELYSYKINLRNAIGQKIDFTKVIGDGDCAVTFKVDSNGRLINRNFVKQSSNITLNNAVYNAVLAVPSYMSPPSGYSNETLRLNVSFNNGNFAITLE